MSTADSLLDAATGVYSRAAWEHLAEREISRSRRYGDALTLAFISVDPASLGDDHDATLRKVASCIKERCRREDLVARIRDNVFSVLAVTMSGDGESLAEAIRSACERYEVTVASVPHRLTRPFAATLREAEAALVLAERAHKKAALKSA